MGVEEQAASGSAPSASASNKTCTKKVKARVVKHWTVPPKHRTAEQDEAESHLITFYLGKNRYWSLPGIKFSRWYLFFAAFLIQFCIGSLYSWSVFNKPIDIHVFNDAKAEKAVNAFYTAVGVFGTTTAIMGPWIERHGPRAGVVLGTSAFLAGNIITAISLHYEEISGVYIGYGIFCGFGMGLCYISPVSALQKWFPDYRGTAAGFAVGGYGAGSVVWSKAYLPIIKAVGLSATFLVIGFVMATTMYICSIVLRSPHHEFTVGGLNIHGEAVMEAEEAMRRGEKLSVMSSHEYESITTPSARDMQEAVEPTTSANTQVRKLTLINAIKTIDFMFMYIMFFANQLFGLIVLSKLSSMCVDLFGKTADQGTDIVSINGVFNCCGRLLLPAISDAFIRYFKMEPAAGRKLIYHYTLTSQVVIVGTLPYLIRHEKYTLFCIETFILTASYGGGFGTIPCFLTDMFGAYNIGAMHGLILTAWSIGGVVGGITFNNAFRSAIKAGTSAGEAHIANIHKIFVVVIIGFFIVFLVRTNPKDRFAPGYRYSVCGKTVVNIKSKKAQPEEDPNALLATQAAHHLETDQKHHSGRVIATEPPRAVRGRWRLAVHSALAQRGPVLTVAAATWTARLRVATSCRSDDRQQTRHVVALLLAKHEALDLVQHLLRVGAVAAVEQFLQRREHHLRERAHGCEQHLLERAVEVHELGPLALAQTAHLGDVQIRERRLGFQEQRRLLHERRDGRELSALPSPPNRES